MNKAITTRAAHFFAFLAILLCAQPDYATTAVALFVKTFAVVAADGRLTEVGRNVISHSNQCKILTAKGKVAVVSGLTQEEGVHFDAQKIVSNVMQQPVSVYEAADAATKEIGHDLPGALADFRGNNPNEYQEVLSGSLQILVVGMSREGEIQVARRSLPYDKSRPMQTENVSASKDHVGIAAIGESNAIDNEVERLQRIDGWAGTSDPARLEYIALRFIALEIVDQPARVGPPVSIVVADSNGIHWHERGACQQERSALTIGALVGHAGCESTRSATPNCVRLPFHD